MRRSLDIQFWGSIVVLGGFIGAEIAAEALSRWPGSALAWYANLELFRVFESARVEASPLRFLFGPGSLAIALAVLALTIIAYRLRFRFGVALAANLSFVFAVAMALGPAGQTSDDRLAALGAGAAVGAESAVLVAVLLATSFAAFAFSHLSFAAEIATELRRAGRGVSPPRLPPE